MSILASSDGKQIKISLSDIGAGHHQRCAEGSSDYANNFSGSGSEVDLSICYNIVQHHKGVMQFEMSEELGTVLTIYFPAAA